MTTKCWELTDAKLTLTDTETGETETFWQTNITVHIEHGYSIGGRLPQTLDVYGELKLTHNIPAEVFFDDDGLPRKFDAVATSGRTTIELDGFLGAGPDGQYLDFAALSAERIEEPEPEPEPEPDPEQSAEELTTALLASIIEDIANGDVTVDRLTTSRDPKPRYSDGGFPTGWVDDGKRMLELVYNDDR